MTAQRSKIAIIQKYEIGMTRWLVHHGHAFDTFVGRLYPFHPIFTQWYFRLLDEGFPLLKRFFLTANHYYVPRLKDWPQRVLEAAPGADVAKFERNLARVADPEQLRASLWIGTEEGVEDSPVPPELLSPAEFVVADRLSPKHADWWAFPACAFTQNFSGNERAIFEHVKNDPSIHKVVLTRGKDVEVDGVNVDVVPLESRRGSTSSCAAVSSSSSTTWRRTSCTRCRRSCTTSSRCGMECRSSASPTPPRTSSTCSTTLPPSSRNIAP